MAFLSSIMFELEIAPLLPKQTQGLAASEIPPEYLLAPINTSPPLVAASPGIVPLGLRWRLKPELGIPRTPFSVWRRARAKGDPVDLNYSGAVLSSFLIGNGIYSIPGKPLYILTILIDNNDASPLTVQAVNMTNNNIFGQVVQVPANSARTIRFQHPFIGGFSVKGNFTIKGIQCVTMKNFISRKEEWELIQVVGLPAKTGEVTGYDPTKQGYVNNLIDPIDSAAFRLKVAQHFYQPLPTTLASGMQVPQWEIPEADEAVDEIRTGSPPLLERISAMFKAVDNGDVHAQSDFRAKEKVPGIHQPEFPDKKTPDATIDVPLLATVLINAITDSWFALSSGFGTTDFPFVAPGPTERVLEPATYFHVSHDYMVTSKFLFRYDGEVFTDPEYSEEYCALSHKSILPTIPVAGLEGSVFSLNRPPHRDEPWSAEGALTWTKFNQLQIQGNAVAVCESGVNGIYLNTLRPAKIAHLPALFVPMKPGDTSDPVLVTKNRFIHSQTDIPFIGSRSNKYGVASMDPFGRWSDWRETQLNLTARPPEAPRLMALSMMADKSRITGNTCPHELLLEIVWDWEDRSPKIVQFGAVLHCRHYLPDGTKDNGHIPPAIYPAIFQTDNTVATGPLLELLFVSDSPPGTPPSFTSMPGCPDPRVTIELLPQSVNDHGQNVDGEMRRYRIKMKDVAMTFNPDEEWYFTAFVKCAEWRNPALFSDSTAPIAPGRPPKLTTYVPNPIPAPPPVFIPPTIIWAPLPDARGISRFRISFDKIPNATGGYAVFRAFEAKIRDMAGLPVRSDGNLIGRATDLRDIAMPMEQCKDAFTRLNDKLIPPPVGPKVEYEVEIPGTMDGLMAFAIASVTREQETSAMSKPWLYVAVPRRNVPALPLLSIQRQNGTTTLACEFAKAPKPAVVELFRSQKEVIANEVDMMGVPIHEIAEAGWQALDEKNNPAADPSQLHHFRFSVDEATPPSWFPYFYRAASIGVTDMVNGLVAARSQQSNLIKIERLPTTLPDITEAKGEQKTPTTVLIGFKSDAVLDITPRGSFRLEIFSWDFDDKKFADQPVTASYLKQASPVIVSPVKNQLYYSDPDGDGRRTFQVMLDVSGPKYLFRIRLADPLNRISERMVSGEISSSVAPDISDQQARRSGKDLLVFFKSTSPFAPQPFGNFALEISFVGQRATGGGLLLRTTLEQIHAGPLAKLPQATTTTILRESHVAPPDPVPYGAIFKNFFPLIELPLKRGVIRIRLTAPDNTATVVVINT